MSFLETWQLRAAFARRLSDLYGTEVPAYVTLLEVTGEVNRDVMGAQGAAAERLGSIDRVTAERHGAIRVGDPRELRQVATIFAAMGMYPVGFYDLREAAPTPIPVVSTAFRPIDAAELARNPFRMFTSMLVPEDRRFFDDDLGARVRTFVGARRLFPDELLDLAARAEAAGGLDNTDADTFLALATGAFALSGQPVDRAWYAELTAVSAVAADIAGVGSTHVNHLTPRVLDIDELYRRMSDRGITMIDEIQGPPMWAGPDVLLRQTSFRALDESRRFLEADGTTTQGHLRVRFGEVEARGVAPTPEGRARYETAMRRTAEAAADIADRAAVLAREWAALFPDTDLGLIEQDLAYFTVTATPGAAASDAAVSDAAVSDAAVCDAVAPGPAVAGNTGTATTGAHAGPAARDGMGDLVELVRSGVLSVRPIVYEDFLLQSAAGIFSSNLTGKGTVDAAEAGVPRDRQWMAAAIDREIRDPFELYAAERQASLDAAATVLGLSGIRLPGR
ncbi:DUF1338 family protein [Nakamurella sp. YIM 132087]|uniref:2-oxoadipate dioxygenase/decarboxylase n=1 Tax=Nakamurella alba TaxID=2665158 RepID=A0A7K1FRU7_9ACTN|nr:VOC family protein [Nakamurella alba]MTD16866.1 DUF1338 family protein [Nakamurella alba]